MALIPKHNKEAQKEKNSLVSHTDRNIKLINKI